MKTALKFKVYPIILLVMATILAVFLQNCSKEKVVIYGQLPPKVRLIAPVNNDTTDLTTPVFIWEKQSDAIAYQIEIASDAAFSGLIIITTIADTTYTHASPLNDGKHYWRIRAQNSHYIWGDWSDASIWSVLINGNSNYINLLASFATPGICQDVFVEDNIAYVADGEADLTLVDITDRAHPVLIGNVDTGNDDIAKAVWKMPGNQFVYVADMDSKVQVFDITLPLDPYAIGNSYFGLEQNLEDLIGYYYEDSLYIITVSSGAARTQVLRFYRMQDTQLAPSTDPLYQPNPLEMPADANGLCRDTMSVYIKFQDPMGGDSTYYEYSNCNFIFVAAGSSGLQIADISRTHPFNNPDSIVEQIEYPRLIGGGDTQSSALSVQTKGRYAFVADDRDGLVVLHLPDTIVAFDNPVQSASRAEVVATLNTAGRSKDLQIVGDYCFMADGSGGLKIVNIASPTNPTFVTAYTTPYAFGVWADEQYIYVTDRDNGLMIFENNVF
jgi:hypothetical protein